MKTKIILGKSVKNEVKELVGRNVNLFYFSVGKFVYDLADDKVRNPVYRTSDIIRRSVRDSTLQFNKK
jgi:hypothetical protein